MDIEKLKKLVENGYSTNELAKELECSQTTIRYWVQKEKLVLLRGPHGKIENKDSKIPRPRKCSCGETNPEKFYGNKTTVCGRCHNKYTTKLGQENKNRAREFLGGKCKACGYDKYQAALDIHHLDPSKKDPNFKYSRGWCWENVKTEIETCVLLCKNCHAALHAGHDLDLRGVGQR